MDVRADFTELAEKGSRVDRGHDGAIPGIGGVEPQWENRPPRSPCSRTTRSALPAITRPVVEFLDNAPYRRIEATVDVGVQAGAPLDQDARV